MKTATHRIDSRLVVVLDDAVPPEEITRLADALSTQRYPRRESDGPSTAEIKTFALDLDPNWFQSTPLFQVMEERIRECFTDEQYVVARSYCNLIVYGDMTFPHRDCDVDGLDITALYYANKRWERSWAGETLFYDDSGDTALAVNPRPGRLVLFRGAIEHCTGVPSRACYEPRLSLACKFQVST